MAKTYLIFLGLIAALWKVDCLRKYTKQDIIKLREEVREMFQHAYDSYLQYAYPYDELRPLSCDGMDTWGSYSLTLIDALDTLAIMGNYTEFNRVVDIVLKRKDFDADINVSVFETNIRIVGGLLSAHLLAHKTGMKLEAGWPCNGPLLRLAEDAAKRLIAAFDTETGMPYGTINLRKGVPPGETTVTCTAGVGTFIIEFGTLSRLTGDPLYEEVALNALKALYHHRSSIGLVGNHVDVMTGRWTAQDAGIGGGVDSYYEYLVKGALLLERPELMSMFHEARATVDRYLKKEDWYVWATMFKGQVTLPVFQSLEAYWPGVLSLIGESDTAMRTLLNYHTIWRQYGFTPEVYNLGAGEASSARESYPLRPELIESIMYLYRQRRDPILLQMGEDILRSIQHSARTSCGYATIKDVRDHKKEDRMESFFLAETTKYLYLLFDPDNFIHNPGVEGKIIDTPNGECIVDVGGYIFNTEAHPIDPTMLQCCHEARVGINLTEVHRMHQLLDEEDNIRFMSFIDGTNTKTEKKDSDEEANNLNSGEGLRIDSTLVNDKAMHNMQEVNHYSTVGSTASKLDYFQSVMEKALEARKTIEEFMTQKRIDETSSVEKLLNKIATDNNSIKNKDPENVINAADSINEINHEKEDSFTENNQELSSNLVKSNNNDNEVEEKNNLKEDKDMIVKDNEEKKISQQAEIKIESKTTYVNLDGSDRELKIPKNLSNILSGNISLTNFSSYLDSVTWSMEKMNISVKKEERVEVAQPVPPSVVPRDDSSADKSKSAYRLLPAVIREFLNEDNNLEGKCEPQHLLEKIRRERKYPDHPDIHKYELLLSPAPSFMERISLAGEFLHKKQLEV